MNDKKIPLCRFCLKPSKRRNGGTKGWEPYCSAQCRISHRNAIAGPLKPPQRTK